MTSPAEAYIRAVLQEAVSRAVSPGLPAILAALGEAPDALTAGGQYRPDVAARRRQEREQAEQAYEQAHRDRIRRGGHT